MTVDTRTDRRLSPDRLLHRCDPAGLGFATTAEVEPLTGTAGQPRALRAVDLALSMGAPGYNVFATGAPGTGRRTTLAGLLRAHAAHRPAPPDRVYVFDFDAPDRPQAHALPAGEGPALARDMDAFIHDARRQIELAFESSSYQERHRQIHQSIERRREEILAPLREEASKHGIAVQLTPAGLVTVPIIGGRPATQDEFQRLPEPVRDRYIEGLNGIGDRTGEIIARMRELERTGRDEHLTLDQEVGEFAIGHLVDDLRTRWSASPDVVAWLDRARRDVIEHLDEFRATDELPEPMATMMGASRRAFFRRYAVNAFVTNDPGNHAPVVIEPLAGWYDLFGRIEYETTMGAVATDHLRMRAGALHQANGGYVLLEALDVLSQPLVWSHLKEALRRRSIRLENLGAQLTLFPTTTLQPDAIDLDVKVVLVGPAQLYRLLLEYDDDFAGLFKVRADFDLEMPRDERGVGEYAAFVSRQAADHALAPFAAGAVARLVEHGGRLAGHRDRLTTRFATLADTVVEAAAWASRDGAATVGAEHVQRAIDERVFRANLVEERLREMMRDGTLRIDLDGSVVGQVNGLAVLSLGDHAFGVPARISAVAAPGDGEMIDIDRAVELAGPIHNKGFLILAGFLEDRFARRRPLSLRASIVFEQSYNEVEGDSASCAELYALLSALAGAPLRQSIAVTGSVDQQGRVQAIGGVNEKVEGFFDLVRARGLLDGDHGVLIPAANVPHLMLRDDVVRAVEEERFGVWAVDSIEDGLAVLTGRDAGARGADGRYPPGTIFADVQERIDRLAALASPPLPPQLPGLPL